MNVSTSAAVFGLNGPDRWLEWVLALGLAVRREAPEGMKKGGSQDCWRLRLVSPEERPAAYLVAALRAQEVGVDKKLYCVCQQINLFA